MSKRTWALIKSTQFVVKFISVFLCSRAAFIIHFTSRFATKIDDENDGCVQNSECFCLWAVLGSLITKKNAGSCKWHLIELHQWRCWNANRLSWGHWWIELVNKEKCDDHELFFFQADLLFFSRFVFCFLLINIGNNNNSSSFSCG
jgi:hypothetical protein